MALCSTTQGSYHRPPPPIPLITHNSLHDNPSPNDGTGGDANRIFLLSPPSTIQASIREGMHRL